MGGISSEAVDEVVRTRNHFATRFFPHIGTDLSYNVNKLAFIGYMCNLTI